MNDEGKNHEMNLPKEHKGQVREEEEIDSRRKSFSSPDCNNLEYPLDLLDGHYNMPLRSSNSMIMEHEILDNHKLNRFHNICTRNERERLLIDCFLMMMNGQG